MLRCVLFSLFIITFVSGCSGGGLDSDTDQPDPDVLVNAGANQSVNEQVTVTLNASARGTTDDLTYLWTVSPSLTITHDDTSAPTASFVTPSVTSAQTYTFTLTVTDGAGNRGIDTVTYEVLAVNAAPNAELTVLSPILESAVSYPAGVEIILDGSASNDDDAGDSLNPIAEYRWQQTAGQDVLTGVSVDGDSIAFISPIADSSSELGFSLTVTDQEGATDSATLTLNILSASDTVPNVDAGKDHQVFPGEIIILNGVASTTIPAAEPLQYRWLNDSELTPFINNSSAVTTYAVAPAVTVEQTVTFTLSVTDDFGNNVEDSLRVTVKPMPITVLNDSGVTLQASNDQIGTQFQGDFPGQDGQRGADIISENGLLEKAGRGEQGFDFTRLDAVGDEQDDTTDSWDCVRDNVTGLVWEVKTDDAGLHDSAHSYNWFQEENSGGFTGVAGSAGLTCANAQCDTQSYVSAVNAVGLCNFFDWRLPTHQELLSIVHFGNVTGTKIDLAYFPNTSDLTTTPLWYWTSQPSADGVSEDASQTAWAIDFESANDNFLTKSTTNKVRLVRGGR